MDSWESTLLAIVDQGFTSTDHCASIVLSQLSGFNSLILLQTYADQIKDVDAVKFYYNLENLLRKNDMQNEETIL